MKRFLICVALCLFVFGFMGTGYAAERSTKFNSLQIDRSKSDDYRGVDTFRINDQAGTSMWRLDKTGNLSILDTSGVTDTYVPRDRVIYITSISQLSSWAGHAAAGISYFQTDPGKTYVVDPHAIYTSLIASTGGAGGTSVFAGVSAILPDASKYSGPAYDVTVMVGITGATGYIAAIAGNTPVYVWPYPGSGATSYKANATTTPQTLATVYETRQNLTGVSFTHTVGAGVSYWELNKLNEGATFGLYNGSVSAFVKERNVIP